jgi:ABC-type antimicrobial peptide transport system permease subunit
VIRAAVREIDPTLPVPDLRPLNDWIAESWAQARLTSILAAAFAGAALFLTVVGIYGVLSYAVTQRTQEIGIRIAIGARRTAVVALVLRAGMTWAIAGILLGLLGAWSGSRLIVSLLFGVSATDPITRIDPVIALRAD